MSSLSDMLYDEQKQAVAKLVDARGGIAWWRAGTGKTRVGIISILQLMDVYKAEYPCVCAVVLKPAAFFDFRNELQKIGVDCVLLEHNLEELPEPVKIAMLQKPTFLLVSCGKLTQSRTSASLSSPYVRYAIIDELYLFKNPKTERSQAVQRLALRTKCVGLSGSIMTARNLEDIYGQLQAVYKHRYIAPNMTKFRSVFMNMQMINPKNGGKSFPYRSPKPGAYKTIMQKCKDCVDVYFPALKERKITMKRVSIPATPEQMEAFHSLREFMDYDKVGIELETTLQVALKIQQIANGWVTDANGVLHPIPSNKPSYLIEQAKELTAQGEHFLVWCAFRNDVELLTKLCNKAGLATLQFMSGVQFNPELLKDGTPKVVIATEAMGVSVNHFEQIAYATYFSMDFKWLSLQQSMARTARHSSLHTESFYYFLQVEGSMDSITYNKVLSSRNQERTLIVLGEAIKEWSES